MKMQPRSGTTLLELAVALTLMGILTLLGTTSFASARNVLAVRSARDAIVSASARARAYAVGHGGASLIIDVTAGTLRIRTRDQLIDEATPITRSLDVRLQIDGGRAATTATLPYDALGIGRLANKTISITRAGISGGVTFSAYGRPRVW
jgi:type II secretory pathway pseudopilin PulG